MKNKYEQYDFIKKEYENIYAIYPTKCLNTLVLAKVLNEFKNDGYKLYRIFNDYIRAIK